MDKNLTESAWKSFAKGASYKDAPLLKALAGLEKSERDGPQAQLDALDDLDKQIKALRSAHKGDKELAGQLDKVEKAADALRKAADKAVKDAESSEDEEEDSPALLTTKLLPLVKQVRKGDVVLKAMIVTAGKDAAVLLAKRAISPARSKLLKEYLGASGGAKVILGECTLEGNALTFVVQSQAAGLAKKLKAALHAQTELKLKVRVRGEDPDDLDEEGEEDAADGNDASAGSEPPPVDPVQQQFDARLANLEPLIAAALRVQRGDTTKIRAVADFAREKGGNGNPAAGLKALDTLEQLLRAAASAPPPPPPGGEARGQTVEPGTAFNARLAALMPKVKEALVATGPHAVDLKLKVSEAGVFARKREFDRAHALLDEAEALLGRSVNVEAPPPVTPEREARLRFEALKAGLEKDLEKAGQARLNVEQAAQLRQARTAWALAEEAASAGNPERALLIMKRLADSQLLTRLAQASGDEQPAASGRLVKQRQFLLKRWARIPGELRAQLQALRNDLDVADADDDPDELADGIQASLEEALDGLLDELKDEIDDAINAGGQVAFDDVRKRLRDNVVFQHLLAAPGIDGAAMLRSVESALDEVEQAMSA